MTNSRGSKCTHSDPFSRDQLLSRRAFLERGSLAAAALAFPAHHLFATATSPAATVVATPLGSLRGELTPDGLRVFRGIPFAQPPVGTLRFRAPLPPQPWEGTRDATTFAPPAMQPDAPHSTEDCLYLNLWTPADPGPHPVFVWIHGGGYTGGRATDPIFDGSAFAREGIVLVTVAYRLGVFGFMDLEPLLGPEYADSGNNALRDLVAALSWVQRNIAAFGGDPKQVTVGGESAGAKASAALMGIVEARPLFHSVISESGGGERVLTRTEATAVSHSFGDLWRRNHPAAEGVTFEDLRTAPAPSLIGIQQRLIASSTLHFPLRPQIGNSFLPKRPVDLVAAGSASGKRLLLGSNRDESALFLGPHPSSDPTSSDLGNLPLARFSEVFARYAALYPDMPEHQRRIRAVTAEEYWVPSIRLADAHVRTGGATWMYRLDYAELTGNMAGEAFHSLDLSLVWQRLNKIESADLDASQLAQTMHRAWFTFIQGEAPAAPHLPSWPQYNAQSRPTMIFGSGSHVEQRPFEAELRLWDNVL